MMIRSKIAFMAGWLCFLLMAGLQAQAELEVNVDVRNPVLKAGESTIMRITVKSDGSAQLQPPNVPDVKGLAILSRGSNTGVNISIVNGQMKRVQTLTLMYEIKGLQPGTYTLDKIRVSTSEGYIKADPVEVTVLDQAPPTATPQPSPTPNPTAGDEPPAAQDQETRSFPTGRYGFYFLAQPSKEEAYAGEEILLTYSLLIPRDRNRDFRFIKMTDPRSRFEGFWTEEHDIPENREERNIRLQDGRVYRQVTLARFSLFPLSPQEFELNPLHAEMEIAMNQRGLIFRRYEPFTLSSNPVTLRVKPLPQEKRPEIFSGAVGQFQLQAQVDQKEITLGDPVTLSIILEGAGNMRNAPKPVLPDLTRFDQFDPTKDESIQVTPDGVRGRIEYTHVLIPHDVNADVIEPVRFAYFDPDHGKYVTLKTSPISLEIESGGALAGTGGPRINTRRFITRVGDDFRYITTSPLALSSVNLAVYQQSWFWGMGALPVMFLGFSLIWQRRNQYLMANPAEAKRRKAPTQAQRLLHEARLALRAGDKDRFYAQLGKCIRDSIGHRWNLTTLGMTSDELQAALRERGCNEESIAEVIRLLERVDGMRFSGAQHVDQGSIDADLQSTETVLNQLMKVK